LVIIFEHHRKATGVSFAHDFEEPLPLDDHGRGAIFFWLGTLIAGAALCFIALR